MATQFQTKSQSSIAVHRLPSICFKLGSITALVGVSMGIYMGISQDHTLAPVHVHLNLIGWVSLFLFGLFYKTHADAVGRLAAAQVAISTIGYVTMLTGLTGLLLTGNSTFLGFAVTGSLLVWFGFAIFLAIVAKAS